MKLFMNDMTVLFANSLFGIAVVAKIGFPLLIPAFMWLYFSEEKKRTASQKTQENPLT